MKLLLDENLPVGLRRHLPGHDVSTVRYMNWTGRKNGELLRLAADASFDALVTLDHAVPQEQNIQYLPVSLVILRSASNDLDDLLPLVPKVLEALAVLAPRSIVYVSKE